MKFIKARDYSPFMLTMNVMEFFAQRYSAIKLKINKEMNIKNGK